MNLLLHGVEDFQIERGDTLRNPVFTNPSSNGLATFDVVIANPPFGLKNWGRDVWESDPWGRPTVGLPNEQAGDFAWLQHMMHSMASGSGRMAVVMPQSVLFKGGSEGAMRKKLLQNGAVDAVIGLPLNMDGSEGPRAQSTRAFVRNFAQKCELPIAFWDERLSTSAVTRTMIEADISRAKQAKVVDKLAASYILQGALDRRRL